MKIHFRKSDVFEKNTAIEIRVDKVDIYNYPFLVRKDGYIVGCLDEPVFTM